jgi:hypothetical protein
MADSTPPAEPKPSQVTVSKVVPIPWKYPAIGLGFLVLLGVIGYLVVSNTPRAEPPPAATLAAEPAPLPLTSSKKLLGCGIAQAEDCSRVSPETYNSWNGIDAQPGARSLVCAKGQAKLVPDVSDGGKQKLDLCACQCE